MDSAVISDLLRQTVGIALQLGGPLLILCMLIGVVVAIFQAVTQIHEQSIGFMLKLIVVVVVLLAAGGWMMELLQDYTYSIFELMRTT